MIKYFLSQDQDCHWYLIPAEFRADWERWTELPPEDDEAWSVPVYAEMLGGGPDDLEFFLEN